MCWTFPAIALPWIVLSVPSQIVQVYFLLSDLLPFARFVRQATCHWPWRRPICVEHSQQLYYLSSFSVSYHKLFKATFQCQLCSHDCYLHRPQRLITNCSMLFPAIRCAFSRSSRAIKPNLSLTTRAPSMWLTSQQFHYILSSSVSYHNGSRLLPTVSCAPIAATVGSPVGPMCYLIMLVLNIQPHVLDRIWQCLFWISSLMYWIAFVNACFEYPASCTGLQLTMFVPDIQPCTSSLMYWIACVIACSLNPASCTGWH